MLKKETARGLQKIAEILRVRAIFGSYGMRR